MRPDETRGEEKRGQNEKRYRSKGGEESVEDVLKRREKELVDSSTWI